MDAWTPDPIKDHTHLVSPLCVCAPRVTATWFYPHNLYCDSRQLQVENGD
jgi:hypothetical protein